MTLPVPGSQIVRKTRKKKTREKLAGREKRKRKGEKKIPKKEKGKVNLDWST